jgi:hypothetical protein
VLGNPIALPAAALPYVDLAQTVATFQKACEFSSSDAEVWTRFLHEHQEKIGGQCAVCNQIRAEEKRIGKIRNTALTEEERIERRDKQRTRDQLKKAMRLHLSEQIDAHAPIRNWWCTGAGVSMLPLAGADVPYVMPEHTSTDDIEQLNAEHVERERLKSASGSDIYTQLDVSMDDMYDNGRLRQPMAPMLHPKSKQKKLDIGTEMAHKVTRVRARSRATTYTVLDLRVSAPTIMLMITSESMLI